MPGQCQEEAGEGGVNYESMATNQHLTPLPLHWQSVHLNSAQLVKAVDKLSGKLQAMNRLLPSAGLQQ